MQSASNAGQMTDHGEYTNSWASIPTEIYRDSGLSFQCMGEPLAPNEASWFRSPSHSDGNVAGPCPSPLPLILSRSMPETRNVESWLSDASFSDEDDEYYEHDEHDVLVSLLVSTSLSLSNFTRLKQLRWLLRRAVLSKSIPDVHLVFQSAFLRGRRL